MNRKYHRILITTILPDNLVAEKNLSFAACNFSRNLISGGGFDKVYSSLPHFVHGELPTITDNSYELIYSPLHRKYGLFSKISSLHDQWLLFKRIPREASVWLYNLCQMNFVLVILLKILKPNVQINVIELDFTPSPKFSILGLCLYLMNHAHGMICLSDSPLFTNKNKHCIPGVVPSNPVDAPTIDNTTPTFLLSGALNESISSLSLVLEAFSQMPECKLHITGKSAEDSIIYKYTAKYQNIIYHAQLPYNEYLELLHSVTYQLSTRDPKHLDNSCNFPSKIIEALVHNRAIISTIKYKQLEGIKIHYIDVDNIKTDILQIINKKQDILKQYCNQKEIAYRLFSPIKWYETMKEIEDYEQ